MSKGVFPTMLNKRATMLSSFTRADLVIVGISYFVLSIFKISGIPSLAVIATLVFALKFIQRNFQLGFFRNLKSEKKLSWGYKL